MAGEGLVQEVKSVPWWAWVAAGLLIVGVLIARARSSTASTTAATTTDTGTGTVDSISSADQGVEAQVLEQLQQLQQNQTTANQTTASTPGPTPAVAQEILQGAGYWLGSGVEQPIQDANTSKWYSWLSPAAASSQPGVQRYVQFVPGIFTAVTAKTVLAPGTPQFILSGPPIPGYNYGAKVTAS